MEGSTTNEKAPRSSGSYLLARTLTQAATLESEGRLEEAVQAFSNAYDLDSRCDIALYQAARVLRRLGRNREACSFIDEAVRSADEDWLLRACRAESYALSGQYSRTVEEFAEIDRLEGSHCPSNTLDYALIKEGRCREAIDEVHNYIRICDDSDHHPWHTLGYAYLENGQIRRAKRCFRIALKINPQHAESLFHFGLAHLAEGNMDLARQALSQLKGLDIAWAGFLWMHMHSC